MWVGVCVGLIHIYIYIMFNPKKTVCIKLGSKIHNDEHVSMNGFTVQWSESVRHLTLLTLHCLTRWIADTNDQCL